MMVMIIPYNMDPFMSLAMPETDMSERSRSGSLWFPLSQVGLRADAGWRRSGCLDYQRVQNTFLIDSLEF